MLKNALVLILSIFILSSCVTGPGGYFKRSANNKLFDRKGFQGGKRAPLYNKKYIEKAKRNVATSSFEDDEDDSTYEENEYNPSNSENVSIENREMYRRMLEEDMERKGSKRHSRSSYKDQEYPSISRANSGFYEDRNESSDLKKELDEIKSMLNEAKRDIASRKCPTADEMERQRALNQTNSQRQKISNTNKKINGGTDTTIIEPVKSI